MRTLKSTEINSINTEDVTCMGDFEEALRNIDVYCRVLAKKLIDDEEQASSNITIEPIEDLLRRKYFVQKEETETKSIEPPLIPLPHLETPLVDVFEEEDQFKVLMQCRCRDQKVTVHTDIDSMEICKKECYTDSQGSKVCSDNCQRLDIPVNRLQMEKMISKCSNNEVFEIDIPKKS
jgi:hypothetical protein